MAWPYGRATLVIGIGSTCVLGLAVAALYFVSFGSLLAEVPMSTVPTRTPLVLAGGRLQLSLSSKEILTGSCKRLTVAIELSRGGHVFQTITGDGQVFYDDDADSPHGSTSQLSTVTVPDEGMDAVKTSYGLEPAGCTTQVHGLVLQFRKPRW